MTQLRFEKVDAMPSELVKGTIYFDKSSNLIKIATDDNAYDVFSGVCGVDWDGSVNTLSFVNERGENIVIENIAITDEIISELNKARAGIGFVDSSNNYTESQMEDTSYIKGSTTVLDSLKALDSELRKTNESFYNDIADISTAIADISTAIADSSTHVRVSNSVTPKKSEAYLIMQENSSRVEGGAFNWSTFEQYFQYIRTDKEVDYYEIKPGYSISAELPRGRRDTVYGLSYNRRNLPQYATIILNLTRSGYIFQDNMPANFPVLRVTEYTADASIVFMQNEMIINERLATERKVNKMILDELSRFDRLDYKIVDSLPQEGLTGVRYLVKHATGNSYEEYIYVDEAWYDIGATNDIDLSTYYTKTETDTLLKNKADREKVDIMDVSVTKLVDDVSFIENNAIFSVVSDSSAITATKDGSVVNISGDFDDYENLKEVTYAELVNMRDSSSLIPGTWYRIIDYVTITTNAIQIDSSIFNIRSAGNPFDIIVRANGTDELCEDGYAALHEGDTYFKGHELNKWRLKYTVDNRRYGWGNIETGRGVIYWLEDANNNACPYDFKNIQMSVGATQFGGTVQGRFYYTFSAVSGNLDQTIRDLSHILPDDCYGNRIDGDAIGYTLQFNVFRNQPNLSIHLKCTNNRIGFGSLLNVFNHNCNDNVLGPNCNNNQFDKLCHNNIVGEYSSYNTFDNECANNTLGSYCNKNSFGMQCYGNNIGHACSTNVFFNNFSGNTLYNSCTSNIFDGYISFCTFFKNLSYLRVIGGNSVTAPVKNARILEGVSGTSANVRRTVAFSKNTDYVQTLAKTTDGKYRTWNIADLPTPEDNIKDVPALPYTDIDTDALYRINEPTYYHNNTEITISACYISRDETKINADSGGLNILVNPGDPDEGTDDLYEVTPWTYVTDTMIEPLIPSLIYPSSFDDAAFVRIGTDSYDYIGNFSKKDNYTLWYNPTGNYDDWQEVSSVSSLVTDGVTTVDASGMLQANAIIPVNSLPTTDIKEDSFYRVTETIEWEEYHYSYNGTPVENMTLYSVDDTDKLVVTVDGFTLIDGASEQTIAWTDVSDELIETLLTDGIISVVETSSASFCKSEFGYDIMSAYAIDPVTESFTMTKIFGRENGAWKSHSVIRLTSAQYKHLSDAQKNDGTVYIRDEGHNSLIDFDYATLSNQPSINNVLLEGNKSWEDLGLPVEENMQEVTYAELKDLRDESKLKAGKWYRITDYQCTTTQADTQSANHPFDIIVTADSAGTLNEEARAALHNGDTYFANNDLTAWKLKYCLDNDTIRFAWADATNGKGVVYYMRDEFNNECPYDFKNIMFKRKITFTEGYPKLDLAGGVDTWCYTFTATKYDLASGTWSEIVDGSLESPHGHMSDEGCGTYHHNIIKEYIEIYNDDEDRSKAGLAYLSNNVFLGHFEYNGGEGDFQYAYCSDSNTLGVNCHSNTFGYGCSHNTFGDGCTSNTLGDGCNTNTFGRDCDSNTFRDNCTRNTFGNGCTSNTFGSRCNSNTIGNNCSRNAFGVLCQVNTFGSSCTGNTFGNSCSGNTFFNRCENIEMPSYSTYIEITMSKNVVLLAASTTDANNYLCNIKIEGVCGESSNKKTIVHPTTNDNFITIYRPKDSQIISV